VRARATALGVVALALLATSGCRYHIEHVHDGQAVPPAGLATLVPGETNIAEALAALGAPDGVEWTLDHDVLLYDRWELRRTHWELENPMTFVGRVTPQSMVGEAVSFVLFVGSRTAQVLPRPSRPKDVPRVGRPGFTSKPLTLDGDEQGRERVRLVFDRQTQVLAQVEVARRRPSGGVGGLARGTFLR
jgi:hypothetical protein